MIELDKIYNNKELKVLDEKLGTKYEIIANINGKCFVMDVNGRYGYNDCFTTTQNDYFKSQRYQLVIPNKIVKFYQYYIMSCHEEEGLWFRGTRNGNGNYEFDCCAESLEEIINSL